MTSAFNQEGLVRITVFTKSWRIRTYYHNRCGRCPTCAHYVMGEALPKDLTLDVIERTRFWEANEVWSAIHREILDSTYSDSPSNT